MASKRLHAKRYAQAVFSIALEKNELDRWHSDLKKVAVLGRDARIVTLLQNPKFPSDIRAGILAEQLKDVSPLVLNLIQLLLARRSLSMSSAIADEYERLLYKHRGIEKAKVTTAIPLSDEEKQELTERIGAIIGKKVVLESEVKPDLIGGIVVRIGGKLLDGSTRNKLLALRRELAGAPV